MLLALGAGRWDLQWPGWSNPAAARKASRTDSAFDLESILAREQNVVGIASAKTGRGLEDWRMWTTGRSA